MRFQSVLIQFSQSRKVQDRLEVLPVLLNGDPLPWVAKLKHLGNILESSNLMQQDCSVKRGKFIGKINSLRQEFHFADPSIQIKLLNIYTTSFYGSCLWEVFGHDCERFYTSWNIAVRNVFNLPWTTHRYWIEAISNSLHPKVMLCARHVKFHKTLTSSKKLSVRFLSRLVEDDLRTRFGQTLSNIRRECQVELNSKLSPSLVKTVMRYQKFWENERWRTEPLGELLQVREGQLELAAFTYDEIKTMLEFLCTS